MMEDLDKEQISNQQQKRRELLKQRSKRCVCKYCGGQLKVRQILFSKYDEARVECFCQNCNRIEFGVEREIYASAKSFVEETGFNCYPDLDDNEKTRQMTISKLCEVITWQNQHIGILTEEGYTIPIKNHGQYAGACMTLSEEELAEILRTDNL